MHTIPENLITTDAVPFLSRNGVTSFVVRTDKIHPVISGNKWFKLRYFLEEALQQGKQRVVTFGGAYSNHVVATAAACRQIGIASAAIIRGEEPKNLSHTLRDALDLGMRLYYISRTAYRNRELPPGLLNGDDYLIPEGGYAPLGAAGAATINYPKENCDFLCCAVGTGAMMAGLINGKMAHTTVLGFSVLKNHYDLEKEVQRLAIDKTAPVAIHHDFHFGGYAKYNAALVSFMNSFYGATGIPTDFVYNAKLFFGVNTLIERHFFPKGARIMVVHCGGLQGNRSLPKGAINF